MGPDLVEKALLEFETLCRQQGLPLTVQRREILRAVLERDDHPTAEQVYETVKDKLPGLSRTTVYRVLDTLATLGVVKRLQHLGATARFEGQTDRHHHLVCRLCDAIVDYESDALNQLQLPPSAGDGFQIEDYSIQITGVCARCAKHASSDS